VNIRIWAAGAALFVSALIVPASTTVAERAFALGAGRAGQGIPRVDRGQLMRDVTTLASPAFEGRKAGTRGDLRARQYIQDSYRMIGLQPGAPLGLYLHRFPGGAANVVGLLNGTDPARPVIVVSAHYDHLGIQNGVLFPGADDNASGVAALLAVARHFAIELPRHPMIFVAFDAEEDGQRGSKAFIADNVVPRERIALNVNFDMVSRNDRGEIYAAGSTYTPSLAPLLERVGTNASVTLRLGHDRPGGGSRDDWTQLSDHAAFHAARIPWVYFGVEDHADYHKPSDTPDKIDDGFFGNVADMLVEAVLTFDTSLE
jgi:Zn-dependent M28 family amino/carboxypeptidase